MSYDYRTNRWPKLHGIRSTFVRRSRDIRATFLLCSPDAIANIYYIPPLHDILATVAIMIQAIIEISDYEATRLLEETRWLEGTRLLEGATLMGGVGLLNGSKILC